MKIVYIYIVFLVTFSLSCKKSFLEEKPQDDLLIPETLPEIQAILDNDRIMNGYAGNSLSGPTPALLIVGTDDYYVPDDIFNGSLFQDVHRNIYTWERSNVYSVTPTIFDWDWPYKIIFFANSALKQLAKVDRTSNNSAQWDNIKGSSLFYRAFAFHGLSQAFAPVYEKTTAATDLGIVLRTDADISEPSARASVQDTYDRIISDLKEALPLLPIKPLYKTRPSKPAVFALLARVYLSMRDYENALKYSDSCLKLYNTLINYKEKFHTIPPGNVYPFERFNDEVIFHALCAREPMDLLFAPSFTRIDSSLYNSYDSSDLRKEVYFRLRESTPERFSFRGGYDNTSTPFTGLATDEVYFIRAECYARKNNLPAALADFNNIMRHRWKSEYVDFHSTSMTEILNKILNERRKELIYRGTRWTDIRRLNKEGFNIIPKRNIGGQEYTLDTNDLRYTWPIPDYVLAFNPGIQQNPR